MRVLVTAGNTATPIDSVRVITNLFRGRTGARIAASFAAFGHKVRLLTSAPDNVADDARTGLTEMSGLEVRGYRTFDELHREMEEALSPGGGFDVLIHSAAVGDFKVAGIFTGPAADGENTRDDSSRSGFVDPQNPGPLRKVTAGKIDSRNSEVWIRLVPAPKLVDLVRAEWRFDGIIVKFKLEVGITEARLLEIAEVSRLHSGADLMVANTLDEAAVCAYVGPLAPDNGYKRISREDLPSAVRSAVESLAAEQTPGT